MYIRALQKASGEVVDINPEFVTLCQLIIKANQAQKHFQLDQASAASSMARKQSTHLNKQQVKVPELLVRTRRYNQMEIQMDKFLAKKNPVFKQVPESTAGTGAAQSGSDKADATYIGFGLGHPD